MSRAADDAVDRSLLRLRIVGGIVMIVLSLRSIQNGIDLAEASGVAGGILISVSSVVERMARSRLGPARTSAISVALDTVIVLVVLAVHGVSPGDSTSLVLVLPLLEAGVRHGVFGMTVTWAGVSVAIAGWISLSGNGAVFRLEAPVKFIGLLLLVALPAAHLSEHLVERVEQYSRARTLADRRSELLAAVLDASGTLVSPDPSAVDAALIAGASQLFTGRATIVPDSAPQSPSDLIAHAIQVNGAAVSATDEAGHTTVAISLGGSHPRIVVCAADHHLDEFTVNALEILCAHARIALRTASLHVEARLEAEQWARLARIDPLTGLLNRAGILEQLDHALADQQRGRIALAFIDLNRLKEINDQFGHVAGDELLRETARRLGTAVPDARAGRLGGDEFVLLAQLPPTVAATTLIDSILTALAVEVRIGPDQRARIDVSVGIAVAEQDGREAMTSDHLLQLADARMYIDKQERRRGAPAESTPALVETLS